MSDESNSKETIMWTNIDPRVIFTDIRAQNIVILRPSLSGGNSKKAGTGTIDTHHSYAIFTSFEDHRIIGPDDQWDNILGYGL